MRFRVWEDGFEDGNEMLAKGVGVLVGITCTIIDVDAKKMVKPHYDQPLIYTFVIC